MFAFSGLSYTESLTGFRNWVYDTPDELGEVLSLPYLRDVGCLFAAGDSLHINAADQRAAFPIVEPVWREAPSAAVH